MVLFIILKVFLNHIKYKFLKKEKKRKEKKGGVLVV